MFILLCAVAALCLAASIAANAQTPAPAAKVDRAALLEQVKGLQATADANQKKLDALASQPDYRGRDIGKLFGGQAPNTTRQLGERAYSVQRAIGFFKGWIGQEKAVEEIQLSKKLHELYGSMGFRAEAGVNSFLIPWASDWIPSDSSNGEKLQQEVRQKMRIDGNYDPSEFAHQLKRAGFSGKAMGTLVDTAGGTFVQGPVLGELIDLQRNQEVFARAGASEIGMAPNGSMMFPKLAGGATAYWLGQAATGTESQQTTGDLLLQAKKLFVMTRVNNELFIFSSIGAEAVIRGDMARVAALKADLAMLEGTGGTQIQGLLTYDTASSWTSGTDKVLLVRATTQDNSNGDTMQPQDFRILEGYLPDEIEATAWVMRKNQFAILTTRRADAVTAADGKGQFVVQTQIPDFQGRMTDAINGKAVVKSSQVSATRSAQDGTSGKSLTYVLTGFFPDWVIARMGVAELTPNIYGVGAFENDQTMLRLIQRIDAGPRHLASFAFMDYLKQS